MEEEKKQKSVREIAEEELRAEITREAKDKLKSKMKQLHQARQVVANLERELSDLEEEAQAKINEL